MDDQAKRGARLADANHLLALMRSYNSGDGRRFLSVASQLAAQAASRGHVRVAEEMQALIAEAKGQISHLETSKDPIPVVRPKGELAGLVSASFPRTKLTDLVLAPDLGRKLERVVKEHRQRSKLAQHGLEPRRKFLLCGPPGTGKTMSAAAIAGELEIPLFTILLDGVITKYMGESAAKLRLVFEAMVGSRGVYFFDEVDALATSRLATNDVGEARRILNSFLQFLEDDRSSSLILAATNHAELLDAAIFRRFHATFNYGLPERSLIRPVLENSLLTFSLDEIDWMKVEEEADGLSQADLVRASEDAAREAVLDNDGLLSTGILIYAIDDRKRNKP